MPSARRLLVILLATALAVPAAAHHRQTPEVVALTTSGDTPLPRVPAQGGAIALSVDAGGGQQIVTVSPFRPPIQEKPQGTPGDNANPGVSFDGSRVVWDSGSGGGPGRQLLQCLHGSVTTLTSDPTGTATNPAVDFHGLRVAFESTGDLAGTGNPPGVRQVFVRQINGTIEQMSMGVGTSRNPVISGKKHRLAFESTSDPTTGADTGTSQIWLGDLLHGGAERITAGFGPSRNPALSDDGNLLVFESTADLAGTLADTGVSQIFCYDPKSATFARITNDAGGCTLPSAGKFKGDWRITFVCGGQPQFYMLREDQRYEVETGGGVTERVISEMGIHFVVLSTTANLLGSGTTAGKQVYLVNLFKRPGVPIPGLATWFPSRGIPPF